MLRTGIPNDAEMIEKIRVAAWRVAYRDFMPPEYLSKLNPLQHVADLQKTLSEQSMEFFVSVAEEEGQVVAFSMLGKPRYNTKADSIELWALNVHPEHWRKGIGQTLIKKALAMSAKSGFKALELWCIQGNIPAEIAYRKAGFTASGKERQSSQLTGNLLHELHYIKKI